MAEVQLSRKLAAEFIGTAALVVCGPGTAAATGVIARRQSQRIVQWRRFSHRLRA